MHVFAGEVLRNEKTKTRNLLMPTNRTNLKRSCLFSWLMTHDSRLTTCDYLNSYAFKSAIIPDKNTRKKLPKPISFILNILNQIYSQINRKLTDGVTGIIRRRTENLSGVYYLLNP